MDQGCLPAQIKFLTEKFEVDQNYFLNQKRVRLTHESCDMTSLTYRNGSNLPGANKRGCAFPMVIWPAFRMGQDRVNDRPNTLLLAYNRDVVLLHHLISISI